MKLLMSSNVAENTPENKRLAVAGRVLQMPLAMHQFTRKYT
jgi:hypothetical protein